MYEIIATGTSQKLELDAMLAPGIPVVKLSRLFGRSMHPPKGRWSRNLFRKYSGGGARDTGLRRGIVDVLVNLCVFFFFYYSFGRSTVDTSLRVPPIKILYRGQRTMAFVEQ